MKSFLAMLMVLIVSGDDEVIINGNISDRVLLPCSCPNRNSAEEFRWQMQERFVLKHQNNISNYSDEYNNRVQTFLNEDNSNCSLLLTNITADDQGNYRCSFKQKAMYNYSSVRLNVSATYSLCQTRVEVNDSLSEHKCHVEGSYRDTEILWYLDQQLLTNSPTTTIIHSYTPKAAGYYTFNSTIITEVNGTSELVCAVKAKGISAMVGPCLKHERMQALKPEPKPKHPLPCCKGYFKLISIGLVIGVSLILLCQWKRSRGLQRDRHKTNHSLS